MATVLYGAVLSFGRSNALNSCLPNLREETVVHTRKK